MASAASKYKTVIPQDKSTSQLLTAYHAIEELLQTLHRAKGLDTECLLGAVEKVHCPRGTL